MPVGKASAVVQSAASVLIVRGQRRTSMDSRLDRGRPRARGSRAVSVAGSHGLTGDAARERVITYLEELRTTQRYELYRALEYPLYPILRKIERVGENVDVARRRRAHASRRLRLESPQPHRLPRRAAGARRRRDSAADHRRGHQPVRRAARPDPQARHRRDADPAQHQGSGLPDHAEGLRRRAAAQARSVLLSRRRAQLQRRAESRRRPGCSARRCRRTCPNLVILPTAVAYDLVLEDHILARQSVKRRQRPFSRELAEMVRFAVGYRSRAFVTFGRPIPLDGYDPSSRAIGAGPGAPGARAHWAGSTRCCRRRSSPPRCGRRSRGAISIARIDAMLDTLRALRRQPRRDERRGGGRGGGRAVRGARHHRDRGRPLPRARAQRAALLRAVDPAPALARAARPTDARRGFQGLLPLPRASRASQATRVALRHARRGGFARRFIAGESVEEAIAAVRALAERGLLLTLDYLGESVATIAKRRRRHARVLAHPRRDRRSRASSATCR